MPSLVPTRRGGDSRGHIGYLLQESTLGCPKEFQNTIEHDSKLERKERSGRSLPYTGCQTSSPSLAVSKESCLLHAYLCANLQVDHCPPACSCLSDLVGHNGCPILMIEIPDFQVTQDFRCCMTCLTFGSGAFHSIAGPCHVTGILNHTGAYKDNFIKIFI